MDDYIIYGLENSNFAQLSLKKTGVGSLVIFSILVVSLYKRRIRGIFFEWVFIEKWSLENWKIWGSSKAIFSFSFFLFDWITRARFIDISVCDTLPWTNSGLAAFNYVIKAIGYPLRADLPKRYTSRSLNAQHIFVGSSCNRNDARVSVRFPVSLSVIIFFLSETILLILFWDRGLEISFLLRHTNR